VTSANIGHTKPEAVESAASLEPRQEATAEYCGSEDPGGTEPADEPGVSSWDLPRRVMSGGASPTPKISL